MRKQSRGFRARLAILANELWCGSAEWEQEREELTAKIAGLEKKLINETNWAKRFENALLASQQEARKLLNISGKQRVHLIVVSTLLFAVSVWAVLECLVIHGVVK